MFHPAPRNSSGPLVSFTVAAAILSGALPGRAQGVPGIAPVNPSASSEARSLLSYLHSLHGRKMLTGQMEAPWGIDEIAHVRAATGKLPALRGQDLINEGSNAREIAEAQAWWRAGGITTIMWHWGAPTVGEGYQASLGTIDVNRCFTAGTAENREMWADLVRIADHLQKLRDACVPVIWRPMHECSGGWFWWDKSGGAAFVKLWRTMFDYFTRERRLDNLLWFLGYDGSPDAAFDPGPGYYDLVGGDTYATNSPYAGIYRACKAIHGPAIPIALHECGLPPDPGAALAQNALWSWFMVWHTQHLEDLDQGSLRALYNHDLTLTRDELPDLANLPLANRISPAARNPWVDPWMAAAGGAGIGSRTGPRYDLQGRVLTVRPGSRRLILAEGFPLLSGRPAQ